MIDVNLTRLNALSECVGIDLESHASIAIEKFGKGQELQLTIDSWEEAIAFSQETQHLS
ncbi:hypothetical protein H6G00_00065 [Leptolyngbya sp. FACHB-541]|uniref:hypothetical protein n=1 Tax=Leptolyngbya sp. FACHB-541 TaxID=2692810 RepID=UPI001689EE1C|nr:hypothetical protein [Leptolyngbya sp. FACHB-541]MBD1995026.1 hypothetical protein [Leptolyngbya sp. FACHB-541]